MFLFFRKERHKVKYIPVNSLNFVTCSNRHGAYQDHKTDGKIWWEEYNLKTKLDHPSMRKVGTCTTEKTSSNLHSTNLHMPNKFKI